MTKPTGNTIRVNVSVPRDVKDSMDAAAGEVNWSAVATEAFRAKLLDLESRKRGTTMQAVTERLTASKKKHADQMYKDGFRAGEEWASNTAEAHELARLDDRGESEAKSSRDEDWSEQLNGYCLPFNRGIDSCLYAAITGKQFDRDNERAFWQSAIGEDQWYDRISHHRFALGFVEGALSIWRKVVGKLHDN
jgi:hypothetical protein